MTLPFIFTPDARLPDVVHVKPRRFGDDRGWFAETYKRSDFEAHGIPGDFCQDNASYNAQAGTVRGLHYQMPPAAQGKLVRCVRGRIFDVAVDLRRGSPTYGRWTGAELTGEGQEQMWVPPGFAHGYATRTPACEVAYKMTAEYAPTLERTVRWDDPAIGVAWGLSDPPILAPRDASAPGLSDVENPFTFLDRR